MLCKLKSCSRCSGDLVLEDDEWHCIQCSHYFYPKAPGAELQPQNLRRNEVPPPTDPLREGYGLNALIESMQRSEAKWWRINKPIIEALDQGMAIQQIADARGLNPRRVSEIRTTLRELRAAGAKPG